MSNRPRRSTLSRALPACLFPRQRPLVPSSIVLDDKVRTGAPPVGLNNEWAVLYCARRTAYGCGLHGKKMIDGLTIYVRLVKSADVTSTLYISPNDLARCGVLSEFGQRAVPYITIDGDQLSVDAVVKTAGDDLMVLLVGFHLQHLQHLFYYVVYRASDSSLSMIPCPPEPGSCTRGTPLTVRRDHGDGTGHFDLFIMSEQMVRPKPGDDYRPNFEPVLYMWSSGLSKDPAQPEGPWHIQGRRLPVEVAEDFCVEAMFTSQDKAFYADLAKGIVYCDLVAAYKDSVVDFVFIPLPFVVQCERWTSNRPEDTVDLNIDRSMCCIQGSIKFVSIDRSSRQHQSVKVTIWRLVNLRCKQWVKDKEFLVAELWKLPNFKNLGLPRTAPKCPVLMPNGTLSLLLPSLCQKKGDCMDDYICNIEYSPNIRLYWGAKLNGYTYAEPIIIPSGFFRMLVRPGESKPRGDIFMQTDKK